MKPSKKVLIIYANAGAGHKKAALAIEAALKSLNRSDVETKVIDSIDYCSPFMQSTYLSVYLFMITHIPTIWGLFYYLFDTRIMYRGLVAMARRINNGPNSRGLEKFLLHYKPDVVVHTHFLSSEVMAAMKRRGELKDTRMLSVVTDYMMHSFWVEKEIDMFCVAQEASKEHLMPRGVPSEKITVTGIPVDPVFGDRPDKKELRVKLGIPESKFTVLLASGGFGVGPLKELVAGLGKEESDMQLIVVCGKNQKLYEEICDIKGSCKIPVTAYEYVNNMHELMELADIIVTKSGGLTSSEALAKELPLIIISAIPGQEARNSRYLLKAGAAIQAGGVEKVKASLQRLLSSPAELEKMRKNVQRIAKPRSAFSVVELIEKMLK